ncbi:MAG: hypothetical protein Q7K45_00240, partial [Nanoarchaeota archaeon]|nr:hypothetical protein [Nanoarchaeota archaeon]
YDGVYFIFAPSHHFRPQKPLMTEEIVTDLKETKKRILSVGYGPAYLERLLVSRLGVKPEQITLADISDEYALDGFEFYQFDMHQDWPNFGKRFDYVLFPESPLINFNFSGDMDHLSTTLRQRDRENGLYRLLVRSLNVLNSPGQARLTCGIRDIVRDPVKERIEAEFPHVNMHYFGELTYIAKE